MNIKEITFDGCYVKHNDNETIFGFSSEPQRRRCKYIFDREIKNGKTSFETEEKPHFNMVGPMIDVSRGGVMSFEGICKMIDATAELGMNMLMLYTETVFEMEKYPLFGYMQGRYSLDELKKIDSYAEGCGVEVIPCVQTLGHLEKYMKYGEVPKENASVLLIGEEETYEFIEEVVKTMSLAFKSRKIHIGMDEAEGIGMGNYFKKHGLCDKQEIFNNHLKRVLEITDKYGYEAMMWSDMYYSMDNVKDYTTRGYQIPQKAIDGAPENVSHVFWDYYHTDYEYYDEKLAQEARFKNHIAFGGGIWTWDGFLPNFKYSYQTMAPALSCCVDRKIDTVLATMWGNDGCETDYTMAISGLAIFSEYCYRGKECTLSDICEAAEYITGEPLELQMAISAFWMGESGAERVGKGIIYSDLLIDTYCRPSDFDEIVKTYGESLKIIEKYKESENYSYYKAVFEAAMLKAEIKGKLRKAYLEDDREYLKILCEEKLPLLRIKLRKMYDEFKDKWLKNFKRVGFERYPMRFGGMDLRIEYVIEVISQYLNGEICKIEELCEEPVNTLKQTWKGAAAYTGF